MLLFDGRKMVALLGNAKPRAQRGGEEKAKFGCEARTWATGGKRLQSRYCFVRFFACLTFGTELFFLLCYCLDQ